MDLAMFSMWYVLDILGCYFLFLLIFPVSCPISHVLQQNPFGNTTYYHKSLLLPKMTGMHQNTTKLAI